MQGCLYCGLVSVATTCWGNDMSVYMVVAKNTTTSHRGTTYPKTRGTT